MNPQLLFMSRLACSTPPLEIRDVSTSCCICPLACTVTVIHCVLLTPAGFKPNPKMGDQLGYALEQGIPFMVLFGDDELKQGVVKVGGGVITPVVALTC